MPVTAVRASIESWNHAATTLYGYTAEEAVGQPLAIGSVTVRSDPGHGTEFCLRLPLA